MTAARKRPEATPPMALKRAYDAASPQDGARFLVERLWPRGIKKTSLPLDGWLKEAAPSTALRQWFGHDPAKWPEFQKRYEAELRANPAAWEPLLNAARRQKITLIYSSHDREHNNAVALRAFLQRHLSAGARPLSRTREGGPPAGRRVGSAGKDATRASGAGARPLRKG